MRNCRSGSVRLKAFRRKAHYLQHAQSPNFIRKRGINQENCRRTAINDGGVLKLTKKVILKAAVQPIFWPFVGIGNSDFEVLEGLDNMTGRVVDNADFVHLDRIERVSDEELYDRLLNEFPQWLKAAKEKRILLP